MTVVGIIQARTGSTRLPGKVVYPLGDRHILEHVITRTEAATMVDDVVVATTKNDYDDVVARIATDADVGVYRGDEDDVLARMYGAAETANAEIVVRVTGDCPLLSPDVIDAVVRRIQTTHCDYATNIIDRTFPRGLDIEAFTRESFRTVEAESETPLQREHVTPYYRADKSQFELANVTSEAVFTDPVLLDRTEIRITFDTDPDYELLQRVYEGVSFDTVLPVADAIRYIDTHNLTELNRHIKQKSK
jgi:spore coat polysaccharide biosynthesis protein SpsF